MTVALATQLAQAVAVVGQVVQVKTEITQRAMAA
jgi:hypothetical protein